MNLFEKLIKYLQTIILRSKTRSFTKPKQPFFFSKVLPLQFSNLPLAYFLPLLNNMTSGGTNLIILAGWSKLMQLLGLLIIILYYHTINLGLSFFLGRNRFRRILRVVSDRQRSKFLVYTEVCFNLIDWCGCRNLWKFDRNIVHLRWYT